MNEKLYKISDSQKFKIDGGTEGLIYPSHPAGEHTIARISMKGVYPATGYSINQRCTETIIMLTGKFKVRADDNFYEISDGDVLIIPPGTKYRIEGEGESYDIITPQWDKSQNKVVADPVFTIN